MTTLSPSPNPRATSRPTLPLAVRAPGSMAHAAEAHPVCLTGLSSGLSSGLRSGPRDLQAPPTIVERRDQAFVEGLLSDLADGAQHASLRASTPARQGTAMRLFQPMQRVFNMLVLEALCDTPGQPRLDPKKIESSGFVLRRVDGERHLAWLKAGTRVFGWEAVDENLDPAHDRRPSAVRLGHPMLDALAPSQQRVRSAGSARLATSTLPVSEDVQPLFIAPPEVCAGAGKTLLFGALRVASGELTEAPSAPPAFGTDVAERQLLQNDLMPQLREGGARLFSVPSSARRFSTEQVLDAAQSVRRPGAPSLTRAEYDALDAQLGRLLLQLDNEFGAFGSGTGPAAMQAALRRLRVETDVPAANGQPARVDSTDAWQFLLEARSVLIDATPQARLTVPDRWGAVDANTASAIFDAMLLCLQQQFARVLPAAGRFEPGRHGAEQRYVVRGFVRLKSEQQPEHTGCPARLVWSAYSDEFTIAPWFESSGAPVPVIPLPDLMDREQLKRVRPTVAFALPPRLAKLLRSDAKDLRDGKGDGGDGIGLGWICSFSLPIITLCAFIVLNIFLSLFNLIFFWLPVLKICIPIPKAKE